MATSGTNGTNGTNGTHGSLAAVKLRLQGLEAPVRTRVRTRAGEPRPAPGASAGGKPFTIRQRSLYDAILDLREYVQWLDIQVNGDTGLLPPPDYLTATEANELFLTQEEGDLRYLPLGTTDAWDSRYIQISAKGEPGGVAPLDAGGKVPSSFLPLLVLTQTFLAADQTAMLALPAQQGDLAIRGDLNRTYILAGDDPTVLADWQEILSAPAPVTSVNGQTGAVVLTPVDLGAIDLATGDTRYVNTLGDTMIGGLTAPALTVGVLPVALSPDVDNTLEWRANGFYSTGTGGTTAVAVASEEFAPAAAATTVTLAVAPTGVHLVSRNGVVQSQAAGHFSAAGAVVTFADAFAAGERVLVLYSTGTVVPTPPGGGAFGTAPFGTAPFGGA